MLDHCVKPTIIFLSCFQAKLPFTAKIVHDIMMRKRNIIFYDNFKLDFGRFKGFRAMHGLKTNLCSFIFFFISMASII